MTKDDKKNELSLKIETTKTGAPQYANTFNFSHQKNGVTLFRFYYSPPAGLDYIESVACVCVPTPLALELAEKMVDSAKKGKGNLSEDGNILN